MPPPSPGCAGQPVSRLLSDPVALAALETSLRGFKRRANKPRGTHSFDMKPPGVVHTASKGEKFRVSVLISDDAGQDEPRSLFNAEEPPQSGELQEEASETPTLDIVLPPPTALRPAKRTELSPPLWSIGEEPTEENLSESELQSGERRRTVTGSAFVASASSSSLGPACKDNESRTRASTSKSLINRGGSSPQKRTKFCGILCGGKSRKSGDERSNKLFSSMKGGSVTPKQRLFIRIEAVAEGCGIIGVLEGDARSTPVALVPADHSCVRLGVLGSDPAISFRPTKARQKRVVPTASPDVNYCYVFAHDHGSVFLLQVHLSKVWKAARESNPPQKCPGIPVPKEAIRIKMLNDARKQPVLYNLQESCVSPNAIPRKRTSMANLFGRHKQPAREQLLDTDAHILGRFLQEVREWPVPQSHKCVVLYADS
eukprot:Blabericola_migrator_1__90@NODE_1021_length_5671_cov_172_069950_g701_i0_p2_GENE_NODE_1021_length_5671_cov_172_069950_g701_i0NODE_1021_length_5671_cov_172_069950_g701_i0_p2_ORF_typecomplete_len429_score57_75_NODE_1021_length_5671_cov_172_069950_g701_i014942780